MHGAEVVTWKELFRNAFEKKECFWRSKAEIEEEMNDVVHTLKITDIGVIFGYPFKHLCQFSSHFALFLPSLSLPQSN